MTRRTRAALTFAAIMAAFCVTGPARAADDSWSLYEIRASASVTLQIEALPGRTLFLDATGAWQDANCDQKEKTRTIRIDVTRIKDGATKVLVNPPASLNHDDRTAPVVRALVLDGRAVTPQPVVELGSAGTQPKKVAITLADEGSAIVPGSVATVLDGARVEAACQPADNGKTLACTLDLPALDYGAHELGLDATDSSPFRNRVGLRIRFALLDTDNVAQASLGARVKVDSLFPEYSAGPINDGDSQGCAGAGSPAVTWASAETATEHWVEIQLAQPQAVGSVAVYWAYKKPSKRIEVQIMKDGTWTTIGVGDAKSAQQVTTTIRFDPVTTDQLRLVQPVGCGSSERPNLAWIGEVSVGKAK
ncbi:MAG: hypothetical protein A3K19_23110 [Lentisphaerae bacterium RIFOXYB12_FULL_65_16]|nr:MAG: hypothetical protein A3K18_14190 [Lentisphaerae bacterium RIFOXYA12_64_32]OGV84971.1 MAG: hypothetical protein A3K19_23110 [Lentisphaerae bacterium RIFOXYB12_FULL_65_16]